MGDKSPKSKKRNQAQKDSQKQSAAGKAKAKQDARAHVPAGKGGAKK